MIIFNNLKIFFITQLFLIRNSPITKLMFNLNFLSLIGLPPLLGFLPKWLTIQILIESNIYLLTFIIIVTTLIIIFIYLRIIIPRVLVNINQINWIKHKELKRRIIGLYNFSILTRLARVTLIFNLF